MNALYPNLLYDAFSPIPRFSAWRFLFLTLLCLVFGSNAYAVLANAWHVPDNSTDLGVNMRNPRFDVGTSSAITIYSGVQKWGNPYGTANQTGGTLYFKGATQPTWSSTNLQFHLDGGPSPNNQYWKATFNTSSFGINEVIQYYLYLTFNQGAENTYLYGGDAAYSKTASQATAAASPFTLRDRAAFLWHNQNRVVNPGADASHASVDFWIKIGYQGKDVSVASRWVDNARLYFTTDGSTPLGALGFPSNTTQVVALRMDHPEGDPSPAGNAMWWVGTATNLPTFTTIKYRISAWHSANAEEKFADYNAGTSNTSYSFTLGTAGDPVLRVNGLNGDYTTTHVFVDELANDAAPLNIVFAPGQPNLAAVEVFSNLNRRDRATQDGNGDGIEDGMVPPDGNGIAAGDDSQYYKAYPMTATATPGQFALTLKAQRTGAYRLSARYRVSGSTNWVWYSSNGRRDHAVVVSPKKARDIILYELNAMNIGSQGTLEIQRSTFADLHGGPGARPYDAVTNRFNLDYARNLGVNWLWFQPIHPIGIAGRSTDPATGQPYEVGSPYAVKNFFQINPLLSKANTRTAALTEFTNFVAATDAAGLGVMLDAAFNHTAWDCELDASGVYYFASGAASTDEIRNREARFYSASGSYCSRASSAANIAAAPDRGDFGKWDDVRDVFFGRYAALVCSNPNDNGNYVNEGDWLDTTVPTGSFDGTTRNVWRYFSDYVLYWLDQTGCRSGTQPGQSSKGIDGLRADFGQGLPPQCWEYIINKTRSRKWDFVFMSESLDGGAVTYRSNRHFDILNENIVFPLRSASGASDYRSIFEGRRSAYGQGLVLLNTTSHDEENYDDPFLALMRYAVCGSMDGALMVFYGQELGVSRTAGFDLYELNFGKQIAHFKKFNSLQPIFAPVNRNYGLDQLWPVYAAVNQARQFSRALRSSNRYFLNQTDGNPQPSIHAVAKYETTNASPNFTDVVFAFVNLDRNNNQQGVFNVNLSQNGANLFGIKPGRTYNVKNIAAYTALDPARRDYWQISGGISGSDLLGSGLFVRLKKVPTSSSAWSSDPYEAQYLKLYDITPPPAPASIGTEKPYAIGSMATYLWPAVVDPDGGVAGYHLVVGTTAGGSNVFDGFVTGVTCTVTNAVGAKLYAAVSTRNLAGIEGGFVATSKGTQLLAPDADADGDGMTNRGEDFAGTDPLDAASVLRILSLNSGNLVTWSSVTGKSYQVQVTADLNTLMRVASPVIIATNSTTSFLDTSATNGAGFYRIRLLVP